jgi:K+-transporting ATPase ATPase C chain
MQAPRIGASRGIEVSLVNDIIDANIEGPALGFIGQPRVNVLAVNRALDARYPVVQPKS